MADLPDVLTHFFQAASRGDAEDAASCFAADALVHDELNNHVGREAIKTWLQKTIDLSHPQLDVLSSDTSDIGAVATVRLTGDFPGSPVEMNFEFVLADGKISNLKIG
jgi:ketosteroid isomerase-like protein